MKRIINKVFSFVLMFAVLGILPFTFKTREKVETATATETETTSATTTAQDITGSRYYGRDTWGAIVVKEGSTYTMTGGTIQNADARFGSAFYVESGATLNISGGAIYNNSSKYGAIYVEEGGILNLSGTVDFVSNTTENTNVNYNGQDLPIYMENKTDLVDGKQPLTFTDMNMKNSITIDIYDIEILMHLDGNYTARTYFDKGTQFEEMTSTLSAMTNSDDEEVFTLSNINGFFTDSNACLDIVETNTPIDEEYNTGVLDLYSRTATTSKIKFVDEGNSTYKASVLSTASGEVVIPSEYNGCAVRTFDCSQSPNVNALVLGQNIEYILQGNILGSGINNLYVTSAIEDVVCYGRDGYQAQTDELKRGLSKLSHIYVSDKNANYADYDTGALFTKDGTTLVLGSATADFHYATEPSAFTTIGPFAYYSSMVGSVYSTKATTVGDYAFACSDIGRVELNTTNWGESILYQTTLGGGFSIPEESTLPAYAFRGCYIPTFVLPENITLIDNSLAGMAGTDFLYIPSSTNFVQETAQPSSTNTTIFGDNESVYTYDFEIATDHLYFDAAQSAWGRYWNYVAPNNQATVCYGIKCINSAGLLYVQGVDGVSGNISLPTRTYAISDDGFASSSITKISCNGDGLTHIGAGAFNNCASLQEVDFTKSKLATIGTFAFKNCSSLQEVDFSKATLATIGMGAFYYCSALESISLGGFDYFETIPEDCFAGCSSLTAVTIPTTTKTIGATAFNSCSSLEEIIFGNSLETIGNAAFVNCSKLSSVKIGSFDFIYPNSLVSPNSTYNGNLTTITNAFYHCFAVKNVRIPETVVSLDEAFYQCQVEHVIYSEGCTELGNRTFAGNYGSGSGTMSVNIASTSITTMTDAFAESNIGSIVIPRGCTKIVSGAFAKCSLLTTVRIPSSVVTISASSAASSIVYSCNAPIIYVEHSSKPTGWGTYWNYITTSATATVYWSRYLA